MSDQITPLVQRQVEEEEEEEEPIQTKALNGTNGTTGFALQRQSEEEEEELLQTKEVDGHTPEVTPQVASAIASMQGGGQPLPAAERAFFEPRFGHDFSQVRIHASAQAAEVARAVNSRAFTVGKLVVFGAREYVPVSASGRRLLAHELTHIVQQRTSEEGRKSSIQHSLPNAPMRIQRSLTPDQCADTGCKDCNLLEQDIDLAASFLASAIASLSVDTLANNTSAALDWYFHRTSDTADRKISTNLGEISAQLLDTFVNGAFLCLESGVDCPANAVAFVRNLSQPIRLCPKYFQRDARGRAEALIHEAAHLSGMLGGTDDVYRFTRQFRTLSENDALSNADSYALFAGTIGVGRLTPSVVAAVGFRGGRVLSESQQAQAGWYLSTFADASLQHPVFHIFNPSIRVSATIMTMPTENDPRPTVSLIPALLPGIRIEEPKPEGGAPFLSLFGGPSIAIDGRSIAKVGTELDAGAGFRWSLVDLSVGASFIHDPAREEKMRNLVQIGTTISFIVGKDIPNEEE